jgi:hypothetical protein
MNYTLGVVEYGQLVVSEKLSEQSLLWKLSNAVTCGCEVVSIHCDGVELSSSDVDALKVRVVEGLGPISRALALGFFD